MCDVCPACGASLEERWENERVVEAANAYVMAGLCGNEDGGRPELRALVDVLRAAGMADMSAATGISLGRPA